MRTTIELRPEHRAKLLELAARRGEKGFSSVIAEAIKTYFAAQVERERLKKRALRLEGVLTRKEAEQLYRETAKIRMF